MKLNILGKRVSFMQSSARLRREMNEPLAPRSESGQFIGQMRSLHSESLVNGLRPSTNSEEMIVLWMSTVLRASLGGFLRSLASTVPQSNGAKIPKNIPLTNIEKLSCRAKRKIKIIEKLKETQA